MLVVIRTNNDKIFSVNKVMRDVDGININDWKNRTMSEIILRKNGLLYFCNEASDALIVESKQLEEVKSEKI